MRNDWYAIDSGRIYRVYMARTHPWSPDPTNNIYLKFSLDSVLKEIEDTIFFPFFLIHF